MKTEKNILIAFILNLGFSVFEFFGGALSGSIAIMSDAIHDLGDALSIGLSFYLEKKSKKQPDEKFTYGYLRYSVIGSVITTLILLLGSVFVIFNAANRIVNPAPIHYNQMIGFAVLGALVNFMAALWTKDGHSLNQKAVNLHMLEDVLGWIVVLAGAVIMKFTDISVIDPVLSMCVSAFIFINAFKNLKESLDLFLEKTPNGIEVSEIKEHLLEIEGVEDVHHVHIWSMDGNENYLTMHVVSDEDGCVIKEKIREELKEHGINHITLELEKRDEHCHDKDCHIEVNKIHTHHHHHHH